jgi:hypothetical protein
LGGSITLATGAAWSGGSGSYNPNNTTLNATYTPAAADISSGFVKLVLTTTGNGGCNAVTDTVRITYAPSPSVNAGSDRSVCANNSNVLLGRNFEYVKRYLVFQRNRNVHSEC